MDQYYRRHIALKVMYLGWSYSGNTMTVDRAENEEHATVEGVLVKVHGFALLLK